MKNNMEVPQKLKIELPWWWWFSHQVMSDSCDPMDCSLPGSSVHGIIQARILGVGCHFLLQELPCDSAIPFPDIYPNKIKTLIQKYTCTQMFIAALFIIVKMWKQPKCQLTGEWIKKMWYIYTMEYYLAIKRMKFCYFKNVDGPRCYYA